jgi:SMC interacting uncharacterized protein involved in chromosome segregation
MASEFTELRERLDRMTQQMAEMMVTINQTHVLVNSRMSKLIETMTQLAEAQEQVESDKAEKRGAANERKRAEREAVTPADGS